MPPTIHTPTHLSFIADRIPPLSSSGWCHHCLQSPTFIPSFLTLHQTFPPGRFLKDCLPWTSHSSQQPTADIFRGPLSGCLDLTWYGWGCSRLQAVTLTVVMAHMAQTFQAIVTVLESVLLKVSWKFDWTEQLFFLELWTTDVCLKAQSQVFLWVVSWNLKQSKNCRSVCLCVYLMKIWDIKRPVTPVQIIKNVPQKTWGCLHSYLPTSNIDYRIKEWFTTACLFLKPISEFLRTDKLYKCSKIKAEIVFFNQEILYLISTKHTNVNRSHIQISYFSL